MVHAHTLMSSYDNTKTTWWRQPLVHFLIAGAAIFALDAFRGTPDTPGGQHIVVTSKQVERLADQWRRSWGRTPDDTELQSLVRNFVKEEIFYRESLKLGLDINDPVIRQRLGQKMEFLLSTELALDDVNDAELESYFNRNIDRYELDAVYDFDQVYFHVPGTEVNPPGGGAIEDARIFDARRQLLAGASAQEFGDTIALPPAMSGATQAQITRTFGSAFFSELERITTTDWVGPIISGFGMHLVRITHKAQARAPGFQEVRDRVANDWLAERNAVLKREAFDALRATYDISIEVSDD